MADFPALGSQAPQHASSGSGTTFSSYASHAGTNVSNSGVMNFMPRGAAFKHEEFPALNRAHAPEPRVQPMGMLPMT